jgi:hydrogenase maturation protein HypF
VPDELPRVLAVGAHLKNTVAIAIGRRVVLSQHLGDLETPEAREAFRNAIDDLCRLYRFQPEMVVCDMHPDYASTAWAYASGLPVRPVQHHHAHVAACAAENGVRGPYLAAAWDGSGYGLDGTVWGGEFFAMRTSEFERVAHLRPFRLPGGEAAVREGWRAAASVLCQTLGPEALPPDTPHRELMARMIEHGVNAPLTTSVGRLFDAVASVAGVARASRFEGQAAMLLEGAIDGVRTAQAYSLPGGDWRPLVAAVLQDVSLGVPRGAIAARFHNALVEWIVQVAVETGLEQVVLTGGVFQNRYLTERASEALEQRGFRVFTHRQVPPNDGGISLGQAVLAAGKA